MLNTRSIYLLIISFLQVISCSFGNMENKRDFNYILDSALFAIYKYENQTDANMSLLLAMKEYKLSDIEIQEIRRKLVRDKYAYFENNDESKIRITLEGMEFKQNLGYTEQEKTNQTKMKIELRKSNILLIASVIGGLFALVKICQILFHLVCGC